jgi:multidrug efflux system membrane fusion protein
MSVPNADLALRDARLPTLSWLSTARLRASAAASALTLDDGGTLGVRIVAGGAADAPVTLVRDTADGIWVSAR